MFSCRQCSSSSKLEVKKNFGGNVNTHDLITIGDVARRSGFAASAIRFYEGQGLLKAHRTSGGQRLFERGVLRRLAFIRAASNVGLSLEETRAELAELP